MARFPVWRLDTDGFRWIIGSAGLILGAAGVVRLLWPAYTPAGAGYASCGSVISRQYSDVSCSHMLGTAALVGGLLVAFGLLMFVSAFVLSVRSTRPTGVPR
jgi:hypothetical protein